MVACSADHQPRLRSITRSPKVVACGALVQRSLVAAKVAEERRGISTAVIDLRSLSPFGMETIADSVKKTNRVVVAHEDSLS